jgi:hypothetical protein
MLPELLTVQLLPVAVIVALRKYRKAHELDDRRWEQRYRAWWYDNQK